jgi:hypothetical protein
MADVLVRRGALKTAVGTTALQKILKLDADPTRIAQGYFSSRVPSIPRPDVPEIPMMVRQ